MGTGAAATGIGAGGASVSTTVGAAASAPARPLVIVDVFGAETSEYDVLVTGSRRCTPGRRVNRWVTVARWT